MTPGDSNGEGGEARPFRAESITVDAAGHRSVVSRNAAFLRTRSTTRDDIPTEVSVLTFDRHGPQTVHEVLDHGLLPMGTLRVAKFGGKVT